MASGSQNGVLGTFQMWKTLPEGDSDAAKTILLVQPCIELDMYQGMHKTFFVTQTYINGIQIQQMLMQCFEEGQKRRNGRSWRWLLRPPDGLNLDIVSRLSTLFIVERLSVRFACIVPFSITPPSSKYQIVCRVQP